MFNSAEGMKVFRIISLLHSEGEGRRQDRKRGRQKGIEGNGVRREEEEEEAY